MTKPTKFRIVETDNFGGDYPNEQWVTIYSFKTEDIAHKVASVLREAIFNTEHCPRYIKVVPADYQLVGGFEP